MHLLLAIAMLATPAASLPRDRIAFVISGGVSLGSYEAGLTWTIVRYLRNPERGADLAAVTGASAGGVNTLMAAAMWCEDPAETRDDDPDTNFFHDLWAPVGLEDLLPDDPSAFASGDGLLTARPLERSFQRLRAAWFEADARRFRPGCAVSVGLTVTRDRPEERVIEGLRARRQRFVIPWRFQVDENGKPSIMSAPLGSDRDSADAQLILGEPRGATGIGPLQTSQAALASGAFPFAFRSRSLCDCALRCPEEELVADGTCEGPDPGQSVAGVSCGAFLPPGSRRLCKRAYIDGGIFDNAPIGLAVDLAESSSAAALPFSPIVYLYVDPDHRRLSPPATTSSAKSGIAGPVDLIASLVGTARETELARATRDARWQRTTQSTLSEVAALQAEGGAIQEEMAGIAGAPGAEPAASPVDLLRSPRREALGSFLLRCLEELVRVAGERDSDLAGSFASCAEPLRDGSAGTAEGPGRPSPVQISKTAAALGTVVARLDERTPLILADLTAGDTSFDRQLQLLAFIHDVSTIAITSSRFLIGEVSGIAGSGLGKAELIRLRRDLLRLAGSTTNLFRGTATMLRILLVATLLEEEVLGTLPAAARAARAAIVAGRDPNLEGTELHEMAAASDRVARLIALAPRLRTLSARAGALAGDASLLSSNDAPERRLVLSRRFSPLAGGTLFNFSGFLDRPLRDLDFYAGIYDAVIQIARHDCEVQGPYPVGDRPAPLFRIDAMLDLDSSTEQTQRCLGYALRPVFDDLGLARSPRAAQVVAKLARLEIAAQLGSRAAAARLFAEPGWSWLQERPLPAGDPLGAALAAVTSRAAPCQPGAVEELCLPDLSFDDLLDALRAAGYVAASASMREALENRDHWSADLATKLLDRAASVEMSARSAEAGPSNVVVTGVRVGQLWARRAATLSRAPAFDLDGSSIPGRSPAGASRALSAAAHLLPYRVSFDVVRGGAAFSFFEPSLRASPWFSIDSIADLLAIEGSGRIATDLGLLATVRAYGIAFGAGAQSRIPWNGDPVLAPGTVARIALFQERLAVTFGVRSWSPGHRDALVSLSMSDFNGLVYWLALWGR